jgi:hypothetical protein
MIQKKPIIDESDEFDNSDEDVDEEIEQTTIWTVC